MKIRDFIEKALLYLGLGAITIIALPFLVLFLLFLLLKTPLDYVQYKRSRYQQDFPHKCGWPIAPHIDNEIYTAIKDNELPVEYFKWCEDYDLRGYFLYKDILLCFDEPFFFDSRKGLWLWWTRENDESEVLFDNENDYDNTDDCLGVQECKEFLMDEFRNHVPGRTCAQVVFFYERKSVAKDYEKDGLEKMLTLDDFVIYEKGELAKAIQNFIASTRHH